MTKTISEQAVRDFQERIAETKANLHGFLMIQGDQTVAEHYYKPFGPDTPHRMFSVAKSFTSLATGLLAEEGRIRLDDKICGYFPEKLPQGGPHPMLAELTIRQMLSMTTCYSYNTFKVVGDQDWVGTYFRSEPDRYAGTNFCYDTAASHTLAGLVEKLTGQKLLDYLRDKAFREIGFGEKAYIIPDALGVSQGGSGLVCTLRDLAAVAKLCRDGGRYRGKQLLPEWFLREAAENRTATIMQPVIDEQQGYGYMFWRCRHGGHCMYGLGGQLALIFPQYDLIFATIGDTQGCPSGLQMIYDAFYATIFQEAAGEREPVHVETQIPLAEGSASSPMEASLSGKRWNCLPNRMGLKWIQPDFEKGRILLENESGVKEFFFGRQTWAEQTFPGVGFRTVASGAWPKENTFLMRLYVIEEAFCHIFLELVFREDGKLGIRMSNTSEPFLAGFNGYAGAEEEGK
ncbi:MAG: beta-lactamase family protein [Ruminococcus flavefaciens]|nr:beta-lactamase family protein [Ruminococcus flavefaciens]